METLTLIFVDASGDKCQIRINKNKFLNKCKRIQSQYFTAMFYGSFGESSINKVTINVPFASAACDVIKQIVNDNPSTATADFIIKRIYCEDFFGLDYMDDFKKLFKLRINNSTYDLIHQFIEQKEYNIELCTRLLGTKLPVKYDCGDFSLELIDAMVNSLWLNIFILQSDTEVIVYDIDSDIVINKFTKNILGTTIRIAINPIYPLICVQRGQMFYLYDLITGKLIERIRDYSRSACFSHNGKKLYYSTDKEIIVMSVKKLEVVKHYNIEDYAYDITISPTNQWIAFRCRYDTKPHIRKLCLLDLQTKERTIVSPDNVNNYHFIDHSTLAWINSNQTVEIFDCAKLDRIYLLDNYLHTRFVTSPHHDFCLCYQQNNLASDQIIGGIYRSHDKVSILYSDGRPFRYASYCWSHDGNKLYTIRKSNGNAEILMLPVSDTGIIDNDKLSIVNINALDGLHNYTNIINVCYQDTNAISKIKLLVGKN